MSQSAKIRYLQLINHVLLLVGVSWVVYSSQWYLLGVSLFVGFIFCVFGINIALHRYITHQSFETYPVIEKILLTISCLCLLGSPLGWAISHINHHISHLKIKLNLNFQLILLYRKLSKIMFY
jgi:fatty-acid desaturase